MEKDRVVTGGQVDARTWGCLCLDTWQLRYEVEFGHILHHNEFGWAPAHIVEVIPDMIHLGGFTLVSDGPL
eukprot:1843610-Lingulodinium_polyedra.AAC.1